MLCLDKPSWENLLHDYPEMEKYFRQMFQNAIIALQVRILHNLSAPAEERYRELMDKRMGIFRRVPQKYIASYLGITPEFLSMLRKRRTRS